MKSRDRLLVALNHKLQDKIPRSGLIANYFMNCHKNELSDLDSNMTIIDFLKEIGADIFNWLGMKARSSGVIIHTYNSDGFIEKDNKGNWIIEFYDYIGNIESSCRFMI